MFAAAGFFYGVSAFGQVIHLSKRAVVEPRQDVRLGNIATVMGVDAQTAASLAETVILPNVETGRKVRADSVLMAVIAQLGASGVATQLQLSGAAECDIAIANSTATTIHPVLNQLPTEPPIAAAPALTGEVLNPPAFTTSIINNAPVTASPESITLAKLITERLQHELAASPADIVVSFETLSPLLDQPVEPGTQWQFQPLTRTFLGTVQWHAELVRNARFIHQLAVETKVQKHVMVLVAVTQIPVGTVMTKDQFVAEDALLDRNLPTLFTNEKDVIGLESQRAIVVGSQLDQRDFKPVEMAEVGDAVTVVFVSGSLEVKMNGRAMKGGKLHDQIAIRNEVTHEEYQAVLIGKSLAVVGGTLTEAQEKTLRETR